MKLLASLLLLSVSTLAYSATQPGIAGDYVGTATTHDQSVPIHLKISGEGPTLKATLVNGTSDTPASSASFVDGHLLLNFSYFARTLDATSQDGTLIGTFGGARGIRADLSSPRLSNASSKAG